jgi:phosphohistidine phosphatase SixA
MRTNFAREGNRVMAVRKTFSSRSWHIAAATLLLGFAAMASAEQPLERDALVAALVPALGKGGYVIIMRHPSSPFAVPDKAQADAGNTKLERQLDETGRKTAQEMGEAFRRLHIPVGDILSSPAYRARESVRLLAVGEPKTFAELDDGGQSMQANADAERSAWLRKKAAESPRPGKNTLIVTHTPNLTGAFGESAAKVAAGEALIFHPSGKANPDLVAHIKIEEWPALASSP